MEDLLSSLNTQQAEAVKHVAGPILILAGAGSGKTKALTTRIAYLWKKGSLLTASLPLHLRTKRPRKCANAWISLLVPLPKMSGSIRSTVSATSSCAGKSSICPTTAMGQAFHL